VKAQGTKEPAPKPSGTGRQTRGRTVPAVGQPKPSRPGTPLVVSQPPQSKHTDSPPKPNTGSVTTRGDHRLPRQSSHLGLCRVDPLSVLHALIPPNRRCSPASRPQNRRPFLGLAWRRGLGEPGVNPCGCPAGTLTVFSKESSNWNSPSVSTVLIFASSTRPTSGRGGAKVPELRLPLGGRTDTVLVVARRSFSTKA
jgi:hypothetical protein